MNLKKVLYRLTHWETWDYRVKLVPLAPVWFWHCLRSRSVWFFTPANPTLTFGGFEGEGKREMYEQLPPALCPRSVYITPGRPFAEVEQLVREGGFDYPFAVKPDVGMMGLLFRKITNAAEFRRYHERMPVDYIVQEFIDYPLEVSVFYYRLPSEAKGTITGFVRKEFLHVTGDGRATLDQLLERYPRAQYRLAELRAKHASRLAEVLPAGEMYPLSYALNQTRGGQLVSLAHEKDERLLAVFDALSHHARYFYFGRYDVKCASVEDLKAGRNFCILEYNGSGAAPHHVYGNGHTLWQAYKIIFHHWSTLARIARHNHALGVPYWNFRRGWAFLQGAKRHLKVLKRLDGEISW
ncbi:MAG: hypothetical protein H7Y12_04425 [Sphingobacteriaceae bacterium]|nr:hypothetical protein [Cytophagaceae bacterium]